MERIDRFNSVDHSYYVEKAKGRENMTGSELNRDFQRNYREAAISYNTAVKIGMQNLSEDQLWRLLGDINDTIDSLKQVPEKDLGFGGVKYDTIGGYHTLGGMKSAVFSQIRHKNQPSSQMNKTVIDLS